VRRPETLELVRDAHAVLVHGVRSDNLVRFHNTASTKYTLGTYNPLSTVSTNGHVLYLDPSLHGIDHPGDRVVDGDAVVLVPVAVAERHGPLLDVAVTGDQHERHLL